MRIPRLLLPLAPVLVLILLINFSLAHASAPASAPTPPVTVQVPILVYHTVGRFGKGNNVTEQNLVAQIDYLEQNGYTSVSLDQVAEALRGQAALPPKPIALTFDDGWAHVITNVVPVLQSHGFRATFFVIAGYGRWRSPVYLSWDQIKALYDAGMWIGAHGFSHSNLNTLDAIGLRHEVVDAKTEIEQHIGGPVTVFAYPYGAYSPRVVQAVQNAGYVAAVTINPVIGQRSGQIYHLNRITMSSAMTLVRFEAYLTGKAMPEPLPRRLPPAPRNLTLECRRAGC